MTDDTTIPDKHPGGRPTKLTQEFLAAAYEVINHEQNALIYTDEDLLFLINEKLPPEARIGQRTLERWKAGEVTDDPAGQEFRRLYTKALLKQKESLFKSLDTALVWQREAWKIERKFGDWNLRRNIGISKTEDGAAALAATLLGADGDEDADVPDEPPSAAPKKPKVNAG